MSKNFRKTKIYLDTSVLSYLKQDDSPERLASQIITPEMLLKGDEND